MSFQTVVQILSYFLRFWPYPLIGAIVQYVACHSKHEWAQRFPSLFVISLFSLGVFGLLSGLTGNGIYIGLPGWVRIWLPQITDSDTLGGTLSLLSFGLVTFPGLWLGRMLFHWKK